jgi:hypothetical protein
MSTEAAPHENLKILGIAGGTLFALGLLSFGLVYTYDECSTQAIRIAGGVGVLVGMGYPMLLYVGTLKKIAALEARLKALEGSQG